jgi:hypothetical protein
MSRLARQHAVKGVYYGGRWLEIEECDGRYNISQNSCSGCLEHTPCPRSRSRNTTEHIEPGATYDVLLVGAGCVGAAIARELSKYSLKVLWVEAADDVSQGATKGNSGIVHAGYDDKPGSNRAKFCWPGNQMFAQLDRELRFGYQKNGSLVVAFEKSELKVLEELKQRGEINGVEHLQIIGQQELREMEPSINPEAIGALYAPEAGNVIPYEFAIALAENAVDNGIELRIRRELKSLVPTKDGFEATMEHWEPAEYLRALMFSKIAKVFAEGVKGVAGLVALHYLAARIGLLTIMYGTWVYALALSACYALLKKDIIPWLSSRTTPMTTFVGRAGRPVGSGGDKILVDDMMVGGSGSKDMNNGRVVDNEKVSARFVINCAGGAADKVARMIGDASFTIKPRIGDYILLNRNQVR